MHDGPRVIACTLLVSVLVAPAAAGGESVLTGDLPRRADLGFSAREDAGRLLVRQVEEGSRAAAAGLLDGDVVVAVQGRTFAKPYVAADALRRLDGGNEVALTLERQGRSLEVRFTPPPKELESHPGLDTVYGSLETPDGAVLRTIVTRPSDASGPLPALFIVQWVSCSSVEIDRGGATREVIRQLAMRSGMSMIRVERSTAGDSEGPGCHQLDYDTEVEHYRHAFDRLTRSPLVDRDRVVVFGMSLGSTVAPLVVQGRPIAGIVVSGAGADSYYERMLQFDRIGFERGDTDPERINELLSEHAAFHVEYLLRGKPPERVAAERQELAAVWDRIRGAGDGVHYGRPYAYHQQAAAKNFLAAWTAIEAPVLVLFSEYDQFEYSHGHRMIVETVNRLRPGTARYVELPQMGHDWAVYPTPQLALRWERGQEAPSLVVEPILEWLRQTVGVGAAAAASVD